MQNKKAFTLIELVVVLVIIGLLASIAVISFESSQKKTRDVQRKSDLEALGSAFSMYHADTKSWNVVGTGHGTSSTDANQGEGFVNYCTTDSFNYARPMGLALKIEGYLTNLTIDPMADSPSIINCGYGTSTYNNYKSIRDYMKYNFVDGTGIKLYAALEVPTDDEKAKFMDVSGSSTLGIFQCGNNHESCQVGGRDLNYGINVQ